MDKELTIHRPADFFPDIKPDKGRARTEQQAASLLAIAKEQMQAPRFRPPRVPVVRYRYPGNRSGADFVAGTNAAVCGTAEQINEANERAAGRRHAKALRKLERRKLQDAPQQ